MVHLHTVAQRTTKGASRRSITFSYEVKLTSNETDEQNTISLDVCKNAFMQLLGITAQNLRTVQCSLKHNGMPPVDKRGKNPKKWKLSEKTVELVMKHISSYKGQLSHYSLKTSKRIYLPAALNKSKLYRDFNERYPLVKISQTSYTTILDSKFNISFGRNRKDTCSTCDAFKAEEVALEEKQCSTESKQKELDALRGRHKFHLTQADLFYQRKREAQAKSITDHTRITLAIDYQKNYSLPNITTGEVYYKRQLSIFNFNIHVTGDNSAYFFCYSESTAKKGSNEVISFLDHFFNNVVEKNVTVVDIFLDSSAGQNKNFLLFKYLHFLTNYEKRFKKIHLHYPVRGHSYLPCDAGRYT